MFVGAWLSLVERYVRDVEAAGSNPVAPTTKWKPILVIGFYFVFNREDLNLKRRDREARQSGGLSSRERVKPTERGGADRRTAQLAVESCRPDHEMETDHLWSVFIF